MNILQLAILGLLLEKPMHGYELNKRLTILLGTFKALSYGSLYPTLKKLKLAGYIDESSLTIKPVTRKAKKVYQITPAGKEQFNILTNNLNANGHTSEEQFSVQYAFFDRTAPITRIRILESRRRKLEQRRDDLTLSVEKTNRPFNRYLNQLNYFKLNSVEQELVWINEQIDQERAKETYPHSANKKPKETTK